MREVVSYKKRIISQIALICACFPLSCIYVKMTLEKLKTLNSSNLLSADQLSEPLVHFSFGGGFYTFGGGIEFETSSPRS